MKHLITISLFVLIQSSTVFAEWGFIPLEELVKESDLIIIGTLENVSEYSKDNIDYAEGWIVLEEVISGNVETPNGFSLKAGDRFKLKWQNSSFIVCPRVEHSGNANKKGIWLLTIENSEIAKADYPGRFESLEKLSKIKKYLKYRKTAKDPKRIAVQNTNEKTYQTQETKSQKEIIISFDNAEQHSPNQYSPMSAFLVFLTALIFFRVFYCNRFDW